MFDAVVWMAYSRWCWFPLYVAASIALGIIAISSAIRSSESKNSSQEATPIHHDISLNASNALRRAGFLLMADLLHHSPSFFKPPQNSTIFAIRDSAIRNTSHPLWFLKTLLLYHTTSASSSNPFSFHDLLNMSQGTCLTTLLRHKNISLTKVDPARNSVEINNVLISNPNIFLGDQLAVHGVLAPFSPLHPQDLLQRGLDFFIRPPTCSSNDSLSKNGVRWNRVVHLLRAKGYASFSVALRSVLEGIKKDHSGSLGFATIFAPPDFMLIGSNPSTLLHRAVRLHILPERFRYEELASLPVRTLLKTLVPDELLEIDGILDFAPGMFVNGVEIVAPDMITSENFVVHGISKAFEMTEYSFSDDDDDISDSSLSKDKTQNIFTAEKSAKKVNEYFEDSGSKTSRYYIRGSKLNLDDAEKDIEELNSDEGVFSEEG
ncbi:fasciclin-like arabinogalactan protein 21 isoform X1 [Vigna umbellata]|uniref:fasciclin-like arabinogalactan protein 21 isoform X1 n=1 Tax=Vigna umbellata TaxID=87088 RepID=UPI001F5F0BBB|nr:fasciclin-like arabinogalactan protein 21 isoform X1 [Vigna umbellata]